MKLIIDDSELNEKPIKKLPMPEVIDGELIVPGLVKKEKELGRTPGSKNLKQLEKEIIALDAQNPNLSQASVARLHGVKQEEVSYLSRGFDRTNIEGRKVNEGVREVALNTREKIAEVATNKLLASLEFFIPATLDQKELPGAALKLAAVMEKVTANFEASHNKPQFIVFAPRKSAEADYEIIDVSANE